MQRYSKEVNAIDILVFFLFDRPVQQIIYEKINKNLLINAVKSKLIRLIPNPLKKTFFFLKSH